MTYQVRWERRALDELTSVWTKSDSETRRAITDAAARIDRALARDPIANSESRYGRRRITFVSPLAVIYTMEPDDMTVSVIEGRLFRRRRP